MSIETIKLYGESEVKLHSDLTYQICNDCGLSQSDSTDIAAINCTIVAKEFAKNDAVLFAEWLIKHPDIYFNSNPVGGEPCTTYITTRMPVEKLYDLYKKELNK